MAFALAGRTPPPGVRRAPRRRRDVSARAYTTVDELASRVARSLATHGVDARYLSDASLEMLRRAGVSTDELLRAASLDDASDPDTARAAFAEWSKAFAAEVAPSMRAHGVEADALDARTEGMLAAAGIFPDWLQWYQSRLPKTGDVFDTFDTHETHVAVPARRVRGMTLLDEAESEFGKLQVLRVDADATGADAPFAGAVVLMREHTPDAVLSEYRPPSTPNGADASEYSRFVTTGGVFDLFAMLPPLVAGQPPGYPIGVVGLGAGTVARELAHFYPSHGKVRGNARRIVGWELDPAIVHLARAHFGLAELEVSGRLVVRVGDAFQEVRRAFAEGRLLAGIVVDVFDEKSRVLPELTRMDVWEDISRALAPGGRVIANLSTGRGAGADLDAAIAAAECAAIACGNGEAMLWRSGALGVYNEVVITGPPPTPREWGPAGGLPSELGQYKGEWYPVRAPPGRIHGWILDP